MKNLRKWLLCVIAAVSLTVTACEGDSAAKASVAADVAHAAGNILESLAEAAENSGAGNSGGQGNKTSSGMAGNASTTGEFRLSDIPEYTDSPYVAVNGNVPYFTEDDLTAVSFERYSDLDSLGRCGVAYASVSTDTMPTEKRGSIGEVKPTGWINAKYDFVDGKYLYNRCHLIGYQLTAENANEKNLITGTRYLNVQGMLPFENLTADYVKETGNHVLYRVTPIFEGDNLLASGVLMEAESVEDDGDGVLFCVYVYNVQPGVAIDYATGDNWLAEDGGAKSAAAAVSGNSSASENGANTSSGGKNTSAGSSGSTVSKTSDSESGTYILNTKTMKFHRPDCTSVEKIKAENKEEYTGKRSKLIEEGYEACKSCKP